MSDSKCPCRNCLDRYVGCHSNCVRYVDWKQQHDVELDNIREQKNLDNLLFNNQSGRNKYIKEHGGIRYGRKKNSDDSR